MWMTHEEAKVLKWNDMTPYEGSTAFSKTPHIVAYLKRMLEKYEESEFVQYLVFPSPSALSGFFRCQETEIVQALDELKQQGYDYELNGRSQPVTVWDPLVRLPQAQPKESFQWHRLQQVIANPLKLINAS